VERKNAKRTRTDTIIILKPNEFYEKNPEIRSLDPSPDYSVVNPIFMFN